MNHSALVHSVNKSSSSIEHFIEQTHGPQQALQLSWLVPLTVIYLLILVCGLLGNAITILIIYRFRYMQTITNLYLCNLAITDLLSLTFSKYSSIAQLLWRQDYLISGRQNTHKHTHYYCSIFRHGVCFYQSSSAYRNSTKVLSNVGNLIFI